MFNTKNSNLLGVENKIYECGFCKKKVETLVVPWDIYSQWLMISHRMGKLEWGAVGKVVDDKVVSFTIPKQEVTGTECEFKEELGGNLHVHSHHTMGAFASGTDHAHVLNNYEYSIILSAVDYKAFKKTPLPCGGYGYADVTLQIEGMPFKGDVMDKITEKEHELIMASPFTSNRDLYDGFTPRFADWDDKAYREELAEELEYDSLACHTCEEMRCDECMKVPIEMQEKWGVGLGFVKGGD